MGDLSVEAVTLEQAVMWFERSVQNFEESSRQEYRADVAQFVLYVEERGVKWPGEVTLAHLERFIARFEERPSARRKTFALKAFFHFLDHAECITHNPADALIPPPHEGSPPRALTLQECRALLGACAYHIRDRALIELLLATGVTLAEIVRLRVHDYRVELSGNRGQLTVSGSRGRGRILPLAYDVCQALDAWLGVRPPIHHPALFVSQFKKPLGARSVQNSIHQALWKAQIGSASVSSLRHTYAVQQLLQGVDLAVLQQRLGLANRQDVTLYLPVAESWRRQAR